MWPFTRKVAETAEVARPVAEAEERMIKLSELSGTWVIGPSSAAGVTVTPDVAMSVPAVACGINFLSRTVASLSLDLYKRDGDSRKLDETNPLYSILHDVTNDDYLTSFRWRSEAMLNTLLRGRSYTFAERNQAGRVMNLWPLNPDLTTPERIAGRTRYKYREPGREPVFYEAHEIIDIPWTMQGDGVCHFVPWQLFKDAIGLAKAIETFASRFFENGGVPPLALQGPLPTKEGAAKRAANDVNEAVRAANAERRNVLVLPMGHELKEIGFDPSKGQMIEAQRFCIEQFARWFNLPPTFLQDLTRATFSNSEQQDIHLVKHTLRHWLDLWEDELNAKLFRRNRKGSFVYFNDDELLRGDLKSRMEAYGHAIQNGIYTPNEVRESEQYPKSTEPDADKLHIQGATVPLGKQMTGAPAPKATDPE